MKKGLQILVLIGVVALTSGCDFLARRTTYYLDNRNVAFELPKIWSKEEDQEHDLSFSNDTTDLYMNAYTPAPGSNITPSDLLNQKIDEFMSQMESYTLTKEYPVEHRSDRVIYTKLYTATKDSKERQYFFGMVEFLGTNTYVYVLYDAQKMIMNYNIDDIQRILLTMKWNGKREDLALN